MKSIVPAIRRALAIFRIRSLEIQLDGQNQAMQFVTDEDTRFAISLARINTRAALLRERQRYIALLAPGERPIWRAA